MRSQLRLSQTRLASEESVAFLDRRMKVASSRAQVRGDESASQGPDAMALSTFRVFTRPIRVPKPRKSTAST